MDKCHYPEATSKTAKAGSLQDHYSVSVVESDERGRGGHPRQVECMTVLTNDLLHSIGNYRNRERENFCWVAASYVRPTTSYRQLLTRCAA